MPIELLFDDHLDGPPAPDRAPQPNQDLDKARIRGWWPKGAADSPAERVVVEVCRAVVVAGRPVDARQATSVLSTVRRFLLWLIAAQPDVELVGGRALLTAERLGRYLDDPAGLAGRPKGNADAPLSFLRRLGPDGPGLSPAPEVGEGPPPPSDAVPAETAPGPVVKRRAPKGLPQLGSDPPGS